MPQDKNCKFVSNCGFLMVITGKYDYYSITILSHVNNQCLVFTNNIQIQNVLLLIIFITNN